MFTVDFTEDHTWWRGKRSIRLKGENVPDDVIVRDCEVTLNPYQEIAVNGCLGVPEAVPKNVVVQVTDPLPNVIGNGEYFQTFNDSVADHSDAYIQTNFPLQDPGTLHRHGVILYPRPEKWIGTGTNSLGFAIPTGAPCLSQQADFLHLAPSGNWPPDVTYTLDSIPGARAYVGFWRDVVVTANTITVVLRCGTSTGNLFGTSEGITDYAFRRTGYEANSNQQQYVYENPPLGPGPLETPANMGAIPTEDFTIIVVINVNNDGTWNISSTSVTGGTVGSLTAWLA